MFLKLVNQLRQWARSRRHRKSWQRYQHLSTSAVFEKIYAEGEWGHADGSHRFNSGSGSRSDTIITPYATALRQFINTKFPAASDESDKPSVVNIGCGDFVVGSHIRDLFGPYTACDIAGNVIAYNREKYAPLGVDFRVLNVITESPPIADIYLVRQVLQHLRNQDIQQALRNMAGRCRYLILTDHYPDTADFVPNRDIPTGPETRLACDSAVVLTAEPFLLAPLATEELVTLTGKRGRLATIAYTLTG